MYIFYLMSEGTKKNIDKYNRQTITSAILVGWVESYGFLIAQLYISILFQVFVRMLLLLLLGKRTNITKNEKNLVCNLQEKSCPGNMIF